MPPCESDVSYAVNQSWPSREPWIRYAAANPLSQRISAPATEAMLPRSTCSQWPAEKAPPQRVVSSPSIANAAAIAGVSTDELLARHCARGGSDGSAAHAAVAANRLIPASNR